VIKAVVNNLQKNKLLAPKWMWLSIRPKLRLRLTILILWYDPEPQNISRPENLWYVWPNCLNVCFHLSCVDLS
jgi:hypothetical protein